ncbi:MAG: FkbM family methyltransferase [Puia sp.]|nr:FkbM family methyltransferase [Puia sp.]
MQTTTLPNGLCITEINSYETQFLYDEIFVQNVYGSYGIQITPDDVVFDIGANIGLFALYMAERFNPARIICFEPAPHCIEAIRENLASLGDRVLVLPTALGASVGETEFTYYPKYTLMSSMFADEKRDLDVLKAGAKTEFERQQGKIPEDRIVDMLVGTKLEDAQTFRCPITTISKVMEEYRVDRLALAKIDVECAENVVLAGIEDADWPRIDQLVIEVHDQGAREHETMRDMLRGRGYAVSLFAEPGLKNSGIYVVVARK